MRFLAIMGLLLALCSPHLLAQQGPTPAKSPAITEVSLERTSCCGPCPVDKVVFRADGRHTYEGKAHVPMAGSYRPKHPDRAFEVMVRVIERVDFFGLKDEYGASTGPGYVVSVTRGGETKSVKQSGGAPPVDLTIIISYLDYVRGQVVWEKEGAR